MKLVCPECYSDKRTTDGKWACGHDLNDKINKWIADICVKCGSSSPDYKFERNGYTDDEWLNLRCPKCNYTWHRRPNDWKEKA